MGERTSDENRRRGKWASGQAMRIGGRLDGEQDDVTRHAAHLLVALQLRVNEGELARRLTWLLWIRLRPMYSSESDGSQVRTEPWNVFETLESSSNRMTCVDYLRPRHAHLRRQKPPVSQAISGSWIKQSSERRSTRSNECRSSDPVVEHEA